MIETKIKDLTNMVLEGKAMEAFEEYYHDDVVMAENNNPATVGKEANRQREIDFFGAITEFRGAKVLNIAVGDNSSSVEMEMDYTHKDWGVRKYTQVAVQEWKDDKVIKETFYYGS